MAKTKVVVLTHTMPRFAGDSAAAFMTGLGNGLVEAGLDVTFLAPYHAKFQKNSEQHFPTRTYHYFPIRSLEVFGYSGSLEGDMNIKPLQMLLAPFVIIFGSLALIRLVKQEKIDVVSAHWLVPNGVIAAMAKWATHMTSLVSTHVSLPGSDVFLAQRNPIVRPFAVWAARHTDLITSNSPQLGKDLQALGVNKTIVPVVYGVDPNAFPPLNHSKAQPLKSLVVLGVGRLVPKKGFHLLLEAFAKTAKQFPETRLVLVGDGGERGNLQTQARALNIADRVIFAGTASPNKLKKHYQKADIFVLPSVRDERGNLDDQSVAVMEAMASGLAVITTDFPGYRLTIDHGKTGFLFKEGDVDELTHYLKKLLARPKRRTQIGIAARQSVKQHFSWLAIGQQYRRLFK
ncbi:MAG: glycosyltransferase [Patescibacteria group bacterium]